MTSNARSAYSLRVYIYLYMSSIQSKWLYFVHNNRFDHCQNVHMKIMLQKDYIQLFNFCQFITVTYWVVLEDFLIQWGINFTKFATVCKVTHSSLLASTNNATPNSTLPFLHCVYIMLRLLVVLGLFSVLQCDFFSALYKLQDLLREEEKLQLDLSRYISSVQENEQDVPLEILRYV